jgi:hypothetical protein
MFCFQNIQSFCREPHQITEILIINVDENISVIHGIKDILLLNATAVSDLFLNVTEKAHHAIILTQRSGTKTSRTDTRHVVESTEVRSSMKYSLTFDDLHRNALTGIPVLQ